MRTESLRGTDLIKLMLLSLNVDDRHIKPQNRFVEDMGLTTGDMMRLCNMVEDCFRIHLDNSGITCLDELMERVDTSDFADEDIN